MFKKKGEAAPNPPPKPKPKPRPEPVVQVEVKPEPALAPKIGVDVEIRILEVREAQVDRLKTTILTYLARFGAKITVTVDGEILKLLPGEK